MFRWPRLRRLQAPPVYALLVGLCLIVFGPRLYYYYIDLDWTSRPIPGDKVYIPLGLHVAGSTGPIGDESVDLRSKGYRHYYREDGLLEVSSDGPHPIFELIQKAQARWASKHAKTSKSLKEACEEYKRRYGRNPPRGFNHWWLYTVANNVQLPDEYDTISRYMAPFWGIDPRKLEQIRQEYESVKDTYTIGKEDLDGPIKILHSVFKSTYRRKALIDKPYNLLLEMLDEVTPYLPTFRAIINSLDEPKMFADYSLMNDAIVAGKQGRYIDLDHRPLPPNNGWKSACHPDSPARKSGVGFSDDLPRPKELYSMKFASPYASYAARHEGEKPKTFIHNHTLSMDPCLHPAHLLMHGHFLEQTSGPSPQKYLVPLFSFAPTPLNHDMGTSIPYQWDSIPHGFDPDHDKKTDKRLFWRGRTTGFHASQTKLKTWEHTHRARLVDWANPRKGRPWQVDSMLFSPPDARWKVRRPVDIVRHDGEQRRAIVSSMTDIGFSDNAIQCGEQAVCDEIRGKHEFRQRKSNRQQGSYKYVIDVDGNGWSSRFKKLIGSHSLIFKATIYEEWFFDRIEAWVHYVPVQLDYTDLFDAYTFFAGDPLGRGEHPKLAKQIAHAGYDWAGNYMRKEDTTAYMYRLLLEYARIMSPERENGGMDYVYSAADEWNTLDDKAANSLPWKSGRFSRVMKRRRTRKGS